MRLTALNSSNPLCTTLGFVLYTKNVSSSITVTLFLQKPRKFIIYNMIWSSVIILYVIFEITLFLLLLIIFYIFNVLIFTFYFSKKYIYIYIHAKEYSLIKVTTIVDYLDNIWNYSPSQYIQISTSHLSYVPVIYL